MTKIRIVGGQWRGRALEAPEGRGTRPTTERSREAFSSMVLSAFDLDLSEVQVLDAFAGSGALGLELLSRGARGCTFVERDRRAAGAIRRNLAALGLGRDEARLVVADVLRAGTSGRPLPGGPFSLVVLDPPYALEATDVAALVSGLAASGQLADNARVLYEHDAKRPGLVLPGFRTVKERARGITAVDLLERED